MMHSGDTAFRAALLGLTYRDLRSAIVPNLEPSACALPLHQVCIVVHRRDARSFMHDSLGLKPERGYKAQGMADALARAEANWGSFVRPGSD